MPLRLSLLAIGYIDRFVTYNERSGILVVFIDDQHTGAVHLVLHRIRLCTDLGVVCRGIHKK